MQISYTVMVTIELGKILDVDVEEIILLVKTKLLLKLPSLLLVKLVSTLQYLRGVKNAVYLGKMFYKLFFKTQKETTRNLLSRQG